MALHAPVGFGAIGPPMPLVGRHPASGRFTSLGEAALIAMRIEAAEALNDFANIIARDSLIEVPKGPRGHEHRGELEEGSLASTIKYPQNDSASRATAEWLVADISYNTPYAHAQHEGFMVYTREHPVVKTGEGEFFEETDRFEPVEIVWQVEEYTTPGTKSHYLSDPMKRRIPEMEPFVGERIRARFG